MLTHSNLVNLAERSSLDPITLLIGYASVAKTRTFLSESFPKKKDERAAALQRLHAEGHDSMQYTDKGFDTLIIWDPFPILGVMRVQLTNEEILRVANQLKSVKPLNLQPCCIEYRPPPEGLVTVSHVVTVDVEEDELSDEDDSPHHEPVEIALRGSLLDGLYIDVDWPGGINSGGSIPSNVESDLKDKMKFLNSEAKPYAAIKLLRTLLAKGKSPSPLLHLLMSAELILHSSVDKAKACFETYLKQVRSSTNREKCHPWALIVGSRLESQFSQTLLSTYSTLFPSHQKYLSTAELELLRGRSQDDSPPTDSWQDVLEQQWSHLKSMHPDVTQSDAMEELLKLTGLRKVKEMAIQLWKSAINLRRMDTEARKKNLLTANFCFLGNPGTGKTTVARLFASILCDSGIREKNVIVQTTAQKAKDGGTDEFRKSISNALGGVLFIDEAYDLDPVGDLKGKPIVNELLTLCEDDRDKISVILAGYEDDFQKKFFAYNDGLKSRFQEVMFDDFDETELTIIWTEMRADKQWREEDGTCGVIVKRMLKMAGRKGFGNAREVRKRLEGATQAAMTRLGDEFSMDKMELKIVDVIGEDPRLKSEKLQHVLAEFDEKIGWARVKKNIDELVELCGVNYQRELLGKPALEVFLNRMFLGNPGTGKTTCAKLYGQLLKQLGFLSDGSVVSKVASDFVGRYVGESQNNTAEILEGARGKVLLIDEAYALADNLFGSQVLDTLVERVQGGPSDDIAVLLLGYEEPMLEMLRNQNPGLARRFPKDYAFYFDDYNEDELLQILNFNLKRHQVDASSNFREKAIDVLSVKRAQANFGNAGEVELLVKGAVLKASKRIDKSTNSIVLDEVDIEDPGTARSEKEVDPLSQLDGLYRMEKVKEKLDTMRKAWEVSRRDGDEVPNLGHFVFTGSPGTGKTTVARVIAKVLFGLGLLPSDRIVETSALDLTGDYLGQTKTKVNETLKEAKGGVVFIDEAYNLGFGPYGKEAIDTIVDAMTSEQFRDVLIVIAGYPTEIHDMLKQNSGLKSRFTNFFEFPDWNPSDCETFFDLCANKNKFRLEEGVANIIREGCTKLMTLDGWGNGRDVKKLFEEAKTNRATRVHKTDEIEKILVVDDVQVAVSNMLSAREPRQRKQRPNITPHYVFECASSDSAKPPEIAQWRAENVAENEETASQQEPEQPEEDDQESQQSDEENEEVEASERDETSEYDEDTRDEGVTDEIWAELHDAKQQIKELERQQQEYLEFCRQQEKEGQEAKRRHEEELEQIRRQLEQEECERAIRHAEEAERKRRLAKEQERKRREEEERRRKEKLRKRQEMQRRLQQIRPCPMGFKWFRQGGGWRCGGGAHYVSDAELQRNFTPGV